jgi:lipopolysaccharide transport system permease protein
MRRYDVKSGLISIYKNIDLLKSIVIRDIETRYRGTILGFLWAILYPLMMLSVYAFVFGSVFNTRWGGEREMKDFVIMLYCGLIVHAVFSETLMRSPTSILSNPSYVKKIVFPLELLPISQLASSIFNLIISLILLCVIIVFKNYEVPATALLAPIVLVPLMILTAGLALTLAALGVFFRDIGQIIGVVLSVLQFLSPVFYPASAAPKFAQQLFIFNPLTLPIEQLRTVMVMGIQPNWVSWLGYLIVAIIVALFGLWLFQKSRSAFADVI